MFRQKWDKVLGDIPNCWEHNDCPPETCRSCPAYPDMGKECWKVTGTLCQHGTLAKKTLGEKLLHCRNHCDYYKTYLTPMT